MNRQQRRQMQREAAKGHAGMVAPEGAVQVVLTMNTAGHVRMESTVDPITTLEMLLSGLGGIAQGFRQARARRAQAPVEDRKREFSGPRNYGEGE